MEVKDLSAGQGARYRRRSLQHVIPASVRPHLPGVPLLLSCLVGLEILEDPAGGERVWRSPLSGRKCSSKGSEQGGNAWPQEQPQPGPSSLYIKRHGPVEKLVPPEEAEDKLQP